MAQAAAFIGAEKLPLIVTHHGMAGANELWDSLRREVAVDIEQGVRLVGDVDRDGAIRACRHDCRIRDELRGMRDGREVEGIGPYIGRDPAGRFGHGK